MYKSKDFYPASSIETAQSCPLMKVSQMGVLNQTCRLR
ncbi:hypothetical protein FKM82_018900 [Ascaphus truei]